MEMEMYWLQLNILDIYPWCGIVSILYLYLYIKPSYSIKFLLSIHKIAVLLLRRSYLYALVGFGSCDYIQSFLNFITFLYNFYICIILFSFI